MRAGSVFFDSNVLLYARDAEASAKTATCARWLREAASRDVARTNLQVLNEVTHVMLRKRANMTVAEVFEEIDALAALGTTPVSTGTVGIARNIRLLTSYSWWDCLLLASALELGCTHFLSEDLQDGQRIVAEDGQGLTIVDPFAHSPGQILPSY